MTAATTTAQWALCGCTDGLHAVHSEWYPSPDFANGFRRKWHHIIRRELTVTTSSTDPEVAS